MPESPKIETGLPKIEVSYQALRRQIRAGRAPKEWDEVYHTLFKRVKESFEKNPESTFFYEEVEAPYNGVSHYYKGKWARDSAYSPAILLNEYLSKRLKSEGFNHACMRLIFVPGNQPSAMGQWFSKWSAEQKQREYEIAYKDWQERKIRYDTYKGDAITGYTPPPNPGKPPVAPNGDCVGFGLAEPVYIVSETKPKKEPERVSNKYVYVVQCSKVKSKEMEKSEECIMVRQRAMTKSKHPNLLVLSAYLTSILTVACAFVGLLALIVFILFLANGEVDMETLGIVGGSLGFLPVFGGGLWLGNKKHDKLYEHKYL